MSKIKIVRWWWHKNKHHYELPYQNNKQHGTKKWWYNNGQLEHETPYQNGKVHGIEKRRLKNGKIKYKNYWLYGNLITKEEYRKHILIESLACLK